MNVKASVLRSNIGGIPLARYSGNPVGWQIPNRTRESLALTSMSPRMRHPRLNGSPWTTSYAVKRTQSLRSKGKKMNP